MKRIMSHNTWSYLPVRQWWLRPFRRLAQCQEVSAQEQMRTLEAGGFDLRVRFDREGQPHFAHGLIEYEGDVFEELLRADCIHGVDRQQDRNLNPFYVRVLLETTPLMSRYTRAFQEMRFWSFCDLCRDKYRNLRSGAAGHATSGVGRYIPSAPSSRTSTRSTPRSAAAA